MIRINLLAVERERTKHRSTGRSFQVGQKLTALCTLILVGSSLGIGWWYWTLQRHSAALDDEIARAQRETTRLRTVLAQVRDFESRKTQLEQRVQLIEQLRKGQSGPVHMLDELSRSLPEMLWLTQMEQKGEEVTIEGRAATLVAISDFVGNLEQSRYFKRPVEILSSQVESIPQQGDLVRFAIKAQFAAPGN